MPKLSNDPGEGVNLTTASSIIYRDKLVLSLVLLMIIKSWELQLSNLLLTVYEEELRLLLRFQRNRIEQIIADFISNSCALLFLFIMLTTAEINNTAVIALIVA